MAIRYKVVSLDRKSHSIDSYYSDYCLHYKKFSIIKAPIWTLGIFCFKTKKDAEIYLGNDLGIILKVKTFGLGHTPKRIGFVFALDWFYKDKRRNYVDSIPINTVCYKKVKVLD